MQNRILKIRAGFTLIELLLVVVLMCVMMGISAPFFVRSIRGHRLSAAARTLVTVARYARSMAVLKQTDLIITFNLDTGHIDLVSSNSTLPRFSRVVKGVSLAYVDVEGSESPTTEGTCTIQYYQNGVCTPFSVKVIDPLGNYVIVKVDALSSVRTMTYGADQHDEP